MLSYRHSYHAGNYADVLKHTILIHILEHFKKKEKPFCYVDTHAGAGAYSLQSEQAEKTQEYQQGIAQLWQQTDLPDCVQSYVEQIKRANQDDALTHYLGSPMIAKQCLRPQDQLKLYELHNTEIELLKTAMQRDKRIQIFHEDGFKHCIGLMPPQQRRGIVLIDPSYEIKTEYQQVVETLEQLYKRFATGTFVLWYPVVDRERIDLLEHKLKKSSIKNIQLFELAQSADSNEQGMTASGMIVINPPWTLKAQMQEALPYLAKHLGLNKAGSFRIEQLKDE
ncbi:MAG: 23S rRNA (adenine(2030)-N(6))-methyltransferase RlmJ [Methyloprofundus sp.]|nr:23S rRNA (adenine(2030)-N(6))-methyltransferase RlmJ [Methyloprofundus sp.]